MYPVEVANSSVRALDFLQNRASGPTLTASPLQFAPGNQLMTAFALLLGALFKNSNLAA
jgi:hypothetical protein